MCKRHELSNVRSWHGAEVPVGLWGAAVSEDQMSFGLTEHECDEKNVMDILRAPSKAWRDFPHTLLLPAQAL